MAESDAPSSALTRFYGEGKEALARNDNKKAMRLFTKALRAYDSQKDNTDDLAVVLCARSAANFYARKFEEAGHDAQAAIERRPSWSKGYFRRAEVLVELNKRDEALAAYLSAKQLVHLSKESDFEFSGVYFRQLRPGREICLGTYNPIKKIIYEVARGMQNIVYLIGDTQSRECLVVDACWDADGILECIKRDGMQLIGCIVTHNHFDHVGGKPPPPFRSYGIHVQGIKTILSKASNIPVYINANDADAFQNDSGVDPSRIRPTTDGTEMAIGNEKIKLKFIHTPGHTPGSQCLLINGTSLLTGDTLFPNSCGRMDLPGGCATAMFSSLQNILANLDPSIVIYPGHSYGNFLLTTIQREREKGVLRPITIEEWLAKLDGRQSNEGDCSHHS